MCVIFKTMIAGNTKRGTGIRTWAGDLLRGTCVLCTLLAILLLGCNRSHILRLLSALWYYNCCFAASYRSFGCIVLPREVPNRKRACSSPLLLGFHFILLRRAPSYQAGGEKCCRTRVASDSLVSSHYCKKTDVL